MQSLLQNTCLRWCGYYLRQGQAPRNEHGGEIPFNRDEIHWAGHYEEIVEMGWGVAPIYAGKSTHKGEPIHVANPAFQKLRAGVTGQWISRQFVKSIGLSLDERRNNITENKKFDLLHKEDLKENMFGNGTWDGYEAGWLADANDVHPPAVIYFDMESQPEENEVFFYFPEWMDYFRGWCAAVRDRGYSPGLYTNPHLARVATQQLRQASRFGVVPFVYIWIAQYDYGLGKTFTATSRLLKKYPVSL